MHPVRHSTGWYLASSAFWFAQSFKWFILLLLTLPYQVSLLVPESQRNAALGTVVGVGAIWATVGPFLFGWLSYRFGSRFGRQRTFLALGAGFTVVALLVMRAADSIPMLVGSYLLLQISDDMGTGPYSGLIPESVVEEERGRATGILSAMRFAAQVTGGVFGALLSKNVGGVYLGIALVNIVCALITLAALRGERPFVPDPGRRISLGDLWRAFLAPWRSRDFALVFAITWIGNFGYFMIQTYLQNYLRDRIGDYRVFGMIVDLKAFQVVDSGSAVMFLGLMISFVGVMGAVLGSAWVDRVGRKRAILVGGTLMSAPLVPFAMVPNFTLTVMLAPLFAVGMGLYQGASWALVSDILPDRDAIGKDMGIWQAAFSSVQVGSGVIGFVIDGLNGRQAGLGYSAMFLIGATLLFGGAIATRWVRGST